MINNLYGSQLKLLNFLIVVLQDKGDHLMKLLNHINTYARQIKKNEIVGFNENISEVPDLIKLTLGQPDFNTPEHIKKAGMRSIENNDNHYENSRGLFELRENAAQFLSDKYNLNYDPKTQVVVTTGVTEGIHTVMNTILNPGDEVIVPTPIFPLYVLNILNRGAKPILVNISKDNYILTAQRLKQTLKEHPKVKALILNYPNNPVGNTYSKEQLSAIANVIRNKPIFCICDEIYSALVYGVKHVSMASILPEQTIMMTGVSKTFAMTGWRIGLICGPADIMDRINIMHMLNVTAVTSSSQYAASEAFKNGDDDIKRMQKIYLNRRNILRAGLKAAGFTSPEPQGTFYIFAKIPAQYDQNSVRFGYRLAKEAHVGTIPGSAFGPGGEGHLRISYAVNTPDLKKAVHRIQTFVKNNPK